MGLESWQAEHKRSLNPGRYRLLIPIQHQHGFENVIRIGARIANAQNDVNMCLLQVLDRSVVESEDVRTRIEESRQYMLEKFVKYAVERNVPMYSKTISDENAADGIINEVKTDNNVRLMLFKWPENVEEQDHFKTSLEAVIESGVANIGVLIDRGIDKLENILVPVGSGYHSRLAIQMADSLSKADNGSVDLVRVVDEGMDEELYEDQMSFLQEVAITQLNNIPGNMNLQILRGQDAASAIVKEAQDFDYDLIILGSYDGETNVEVPFGQLVEKVRKGTSTSILVLRQHESPAASWLRRQFKPNKDR